MDQLGIVLGLLDDAAAWLRKRGIEQWPESFSQDETWRISRIRDYIESGQTHLACDDSGMAVGTLTLSRDADPQFAHGWPSGTSDAGYVFRMAVSRKAAGRDLGGYMLDWAGRKVRGWHRKWLRIDIHRSNERLRDYYLQHGFQMVAEVTAPDLTVPGRIRGSGLLMQRAA